MKKVRVLSFALMILLVSTCMISAVYAVSDDGLLLYYNFSDISGTTVKDASGNGNDGVFTGGVQKGTGKSGDGAVFDGTTGYIDCSDLSFPDLSKFTLSMWMNTGELTNGFVSILSSNGWSINGDTHILIRDMMYYQFSVNGSPDIQFADYMAALEDWEYVTMTFDSESCKVCLYINGELMSESESDYFPVIYLEGFAIGAWKTNDGVYDRFYSGSMDEIRLYSRVLSSAEIKELYSPPAAETPKPAETPEPASEPAQTQTAPAAAVSVPVAAPTQQVTTAPQTFDIASALTVLTAVSFSIIMMITRRRNKI